MMLNSVACSPRWIGSIDRTDRFAAVERRLQNARFQPRDRLTQHAVAKMSLPHAEKLRALPLLLNFLNICCPRNQIEFACDNQTVGSVTQSLVLHTLTAINHCCCW